MKLYRNAIILVVVLGLIIGSYLIIKSRSNTSTDTSSGTGTSAGAIDTLKIWDVSTDDMVEMTVDSRNDGRFVFVKKDTAWDISSPSGLKVDKDNINSIAINASTLIADKVIEENATDLVQYGFDKPVTIAVKLKDGTVKTLEIGNMTSTNGAYYVKEKDKNKVYTLGTYTGDRLNVKKNDIKDKTLFTFKSADVTGLAMERGGQPLFTAKKTNDTDWSMISPIEGSANVSAISPMLDAVAQSVIVDFIEENPADLAKYDLANPAYTFEMETSTGKTKILLGNLKDGGTNYYAKLADANEVFTIDSTPFSFVDKPLKEIVDVFAYIININDVSKITVEMDGKTVTCDLQTDANDSDMDRFFVDGKDASMKDENDNQPFRKYYQALIGITLSDIEAGARPAGKPDITFTYYLKKDPGTMKVEFVPKNADYYYILRNGKYTGITVKKSKFDEPEGVRDSYKKLVDIMAK